MVNVSFFVNASLFHFSASPESRWLPADCDVPFFWPFRGFRAPFCLPLSSYFDFVVHNQSTECFVVLCCHNTFAKSYDSKVGLIFKNVAFLLPFLRHSCYRFRCTTVTIYVALWLPLLLHFSIPVTGRIRFGRFSERRFRRFLGSSISFML